MPIVQAVILAILQGVTEFLPISSSAHLALIPWWLGWANPPLIFEVVVHMGTTVALIGYFWRDWLTLVQAGISVLRKRHFETTDEKLFFFIGISIIPGAIGGIMIEPYFEGVLSDPVVVAVTLYITAALLIISESVNDFNRTLADMRVKDALLIGSAQAISIVPGISRSGSTIATALGLKFTRESAARFSFLMATPIILGAGAKQLLEVASGTEQINSSLQVALLISYFVALLVGYASINWLLYFVRTHRLYSFAIYCIFFATLTLIKALA